jgi:hypothetical protein
VREARIDETREGRLPAGEGWFILNLGEMPWETVPGFGVWRDLDWARVSGAKPVVGIHIHVLQPGETNGYYHAEAAQEGFVVLSGECLALVEGQERPMRQWDFPSLAAGDRSHHDRSRRRALRDPDVRRPGSQPEGRVDRR